MRTGHGNRRSTLNSRFEGQNTALSTDVPLKVAIPRLLGGELGRPKAKGQRREWENPGDHTHQTASVECPHQDPPGAYRHYLARYVKMRELVLGLLGRGDEM